MNITKTLLAVAFCLCATNKATAYDFAVVNNGQPICYNITSSTPSLTVEVTNESEDPSFYHGDVTIPDRVSHNGNTYAVTAIGESAFSYCSGLTSITIPNSVLTIGDYAFYDCNNLKSVIIPHSVTTTNIGAFQNCTGLTSATVGNAVTTIGERTFAGCTGLTSVTIGSSVTSIDLLAFNDCRSLPSIVIPNSVTTIGISAFYYCSGLTSLTIGSSVTSIGNTAFTECTHLTEIYVNATTPPQVGRFAFKGVPTDIPVYVCGEVEEYEEAESWAAFTNILQVADCGVATKDLAAADIINIYPNPATDNIIISLREMITNAVFTLYDMQGRTLIRQQVSNEDVISISEFAAGIYIYNYYCPVNIF
jgi:hypothetical protein